MNRALTVMCCVVLLSCGQDGPGEPQAYVPGSDPAFSAPVPEGYVLPEPGPETAVCVGPQLAAADFEREPGPMPEPEPDTQPEADTPEDEDEPPVEEDPCDLKPGTCIGEVAPQWWLDDFQPQSCGLDAAYGLEAFKGQVTVAVLLAAW